MPRVLTYLPPWLGHGTPGSSMFAPIEESKDLGRDRPESSSSARPSSFSGPSSSSNTRPSSSSSASAIAPPLQAARRTIAQRGTEVFVAVGNTIRWADLAMLKDAWEVKREEKKMRRRTERSEEGEEEEEEVEEEPIGREGYKTLKVNVYERIRQLIPSPNQDLLAIVTSHTVHIAIMPDPSHLDQPDAGPLKIRTYTLGPTIHVLSQSPVVCALWHPLAANGDCLVTVTEDAVVRLWEVDIHNRSSFDAPTLDLDLTKLHYATSASDPIASARMGRNRGFSLDRIGMHAAAAAFGGVGSDAEHGWSAMTLWVAMTEGDVYALCPLLPTKWRSPPDLVPSLTTSIIARKAYAESGDAHEEERHIFTAQQQWLADIDEQEPMHRIGQDTLGYEWRMPIYNRPTAVSEIPKLQGPFRILPGDVEDDLELSGIHVIPPKMDREELADEDELVDMYQDGLSTTVVSLVSVTGRVYVTLCLEEIEGQWLPLQKPLNNPQVDPDAQPELILLEALDTLRAGEVTDLEWPMITPDVFSRYVFFVTHSQGVFYLSLEPWLQRLEDELSSDEPTGTGFRVRVLAKGASTIRERILKFEHLAGTPIAPVSAAVVFDDSDLGYFVLASYGPCPQSVTLAPPDFERPEEPPVENQTQSTTLVPFESQAQLTAPPRQPFQPPSLFWTHQTSLPHMLQTLHPRLRASQAGPLRLTESTLEVLTAVHREVARETHALGTATAEVFRRCERLTAELEDQVRRVRDCAVRVEQLLGEDADVFSQEGEREAGGVRERLERRLDHAREKNQALLARHEALRKKAILLGARSLSDIEVAWGREVDKMTNVLGEEDNRMEDMAENEEGRKREKKDEKKVKTVAQRYKLLRSAAEGVLQRTKDISAPTGEEEEERERPVKEKTSRPWTPTVPQELRSARLAQVKNLLEREAAVVEGVRERLAKLSA